MYNLFFFLIIIIIVLGHVSGLYLDYLNNKMWTDKLPDKLSDIIDRNKYKKARSYYRANTNYSNITSSFFLVIIILMLFSGGFARIDGIARELSNNRVLVSLLFFGIIFLGFDLISLPFSWYDTFVIEDKFGFNKTSKKTFFTDHLKSWLMTILIGGGLIGFITWIYYESGEMFWIYVWIVISLFSVFMNMFYSELIVPLFNKQEPLKEGELRTEIENMARKADFKLSDIYTIDGSKRSTKANAYFSGLGPKKRIVLFDTLINDLTTKEITAVLAHELAHYKKKHSLTMMACGLIQTGIMLYIFSLMAGNEELTNAMGAERPSFHISIFAFFLIYSPVSGIINLFMNYLSRKHEYEADSYAGKIYDRNKLISALKKLSVNNLSNLNPHPAYVFVHYSHPPLLSRVKNLENL